MEDEEDQILKTQIKANEEAMPEFTTKNKPYSPYVSLVLRGEELDPQMITEMLGITPRRSFKRGDQRGRDNKDKKWSYGFWMFESAGQIESLNLKMHIIWLLEQLEPAKPNLLEISRNDAFDAKISCFWIMPSTNEVLTIDPELLSRIAALNIRIELDIYSPRLRRE